MKVGINTLWVVPGEVGGAEYYLTNLLEGLYREDRETEYILFGTPLNASLFPFRAENFRRVLIPFSNRNRQLRILFDEIVLPYLARREGLDILHSPGNVSAPVLKPCAVVLTIQSLHCFLCRERMPRVKMAYVRNHLRLSVRMAEHVITPSASTRDDVIRLFGVPPGKVTSILDYVSPQTLFPDGIPLDDGVLRRYGVTKPYLFSPSSLYPYKNITGMLRTLQALRERHRLPHNLVVAGRDDIGYHGEAKRLAQALGLADAFRYLGAIPHDDVPSLYASADLTLFPSYCETFGIPVLESMVLGVPVVCSDRSSLPEVAGGAAALVNPDSVEDMTRTVARILSDPAERERLAKMGRERVKGFTCENAARKTVEIYRRVYDARARGR